MNPGRRRWLLRLAAVLVLALIGLLWAVRQGASDLVIENRSEQTIAHLKVTLAGQTHTFRDVRTGSEVTAPCRAGNGDHFSLDGQLADGTRIRADGVLRDSTHFLVLPGGGVTFRPKSKNAP